MKYGILGTGSVGEAIATKLIMQGHQVMMGSRSSDNEKAVQWAEQNGDGGSNGTFSQAATFGEIIFNCTAGVASLSVLDAIGSENLNGKILVDVANPIVRGKYNSLVPDLCNTNSLGEEIQRQYPEVKVVKTFNTVPACLMVDPTILEGEHDIFICSDHQDAKQQIIELLHSFGWQSPIDLGKLPAARYTEMLAILWAPIYGAVKEPIFNYKVVIEKK